ncbi:MAG: alpha/beta hydrolase [Solobacterium sp.]|nr:alpha/beta hydrolase [Solobacterium sp.]
MKTELKYTLYPCEEPKAAVFMIHGMQEHRKRYDGLAKYLNAHGYAAVTYDLPGHGETAKDSVLGYFGDNGWNNLIVSAVDIAHLTHREFPDIPVVMFGHSMGTMIARCFLQNYDYMVDGVILSGSPNYNAGAAVGKQMARERIYIAGPKSHNRMLDGLATGQFNRSVNEPRTAVDWLSYNDENVDNYISDPLCGVPFTVSGYYDLFDGMLRMADADRYYRMNTNIPVLFIAGQEDPCTGGEEGVRDTIGFLKSVGYRMIDSVLYPNMRHEILHEKDAETVMEDIVEWLDGHI